jgi:RND family efflux transporter MFP subunit
MKIVRKTMLALLLGVFAMATPMVALSQQAAPAAAVNKTAVSKPGSVVRALLVPATESILSSQVSAQITDIAVKEGQQFKKGTLLVKFECAENRAELQKARAELDAASKTHESNEKLLQHKAINRLEVDVSRANVNRARAQVNLMRARVGYCSIVAPYSGRVTKLGANRFDMVTAGQPVIEILDDSKLKMELYVSSRWLSRLSEGQQFSVQIDETGKSYPAVINGLGSRVDPVSQTIALYAEISGNHPELLAGMSGVATFEENISQ